MSFFLFFSGVQIKIQNAQSAGRKILRRNFHLLVVHVLWILTQAVQEELQILVSVAVVEDLHFAKP